MVERVGEIPEILNETKASRKLASEILPGKDVEANISQERASLTLILLMAGLTSMCGNATAVGFHIAVVNNAKSGIVESFADKHGIDYSEFLWSATVSVFCLGGLIGGLIANRPTNYFGRRNTTIANSFIFILGALLQGFSTQIWMMILGRFIVGLASGISTVAVPMYLNEISPLHYQGAFGVLNQFGIVNGILIANIVAKKSIFGSSDNWPHLFWFSCLFPLVTLVFMPFCPKTPHFLLSIGRKMDAEKALKKLRGLNSIIEVELESMEAEIMIANRIPSKGLKDLWSNQALRIAFILTLFLQASQQLSGINAVMYYSTDIFKSAKVEDSELATILVGTVNWLATLVSTAVIERTGRKPLMIYGYGFQGLLSILLCITLVLKTHVWANYLSIVSVLLYVVMFAVGPGPIPWLISTEMIPSSYSNVAQSYAVFTNWSFNFLVGIVYPTMQTHLGDYNFLPFAGFCLLSAMVLVKCMVETRGKPTNQVLQELMERNGKSIPSDLANL
eukprot:Sdes_comp18212_c0_seq1m7780